MSKIEISTGTQLFKTHRKKQFPDQYCSKNKPKKLISGCDSLGTIIHEIGHSVGFWHEMSRPDRDDVLSVLWDNIDEIHIQNFQIENEINSRGFPYDPYSIMHYGIDDFTKNGFSTIRFKDSGVTRSRVGQRRQLRRVLFIICETNRSVQ